MESYKEFKEKLSEEDAKASSEFFDDFFGKYLEAEPVNSTSHLDSDYRYVKEI